MSPKYNGSLGNLAKRFNEVDFDSFFIVFGDNPASFLRLASPIDLICTAFIMRLNLQKISKSKFSHLIKLKSKKSMK